MSLIPRSVERAFSKRREAIEAAAAVHGYRTPKGMEQAALRTRQAKRSVGRDALFHQWRDEARTLGFEQKRGLARPIQPPVKERSPANPLVAKSTHQPENATSHLAAAARALDQRSTMSGIAVDLRQRELDHDRG